MPVYYPRMKFLIRPYHPADLPALYSICLMTADNGGDATAKYTDPELLGHYYAAPYTVYEPDLCFVLTMNQYPCGYVLGTRDSAAFHQQTEAEWFPTLRQRYDINDTINFNANDQAMIQAIHRGIGVDAELEAYPAHLHIDLLPIGQGKGFGRQLMETFIGRLCELEVPGVHLGVAKANANAIGFYERIGFQRLFDYPKAFVYGMKLD